MPPSAPGTAQAGTWSEVFEFFELEPATPSAAGAARGASSKRRRLAGQARGGPAAGRQRGGQGPANPQEWLPHAEQVVQRFDQQLSKVLAAALDACGGTDGSAEAGPAAAAGGGQPRSGGLADTAASRALVLEPFVQDRCGSTRIAYLQATGSAVLLQCAGRSLARRLRLAGSVVSASVRPSLCIHCQSFANAGVPRLPKASPRRWMPACLRCPRGGTAAAQQRMRVPATPPQPRRLSYWAGLPWAWPAAAACCP